jgi:hypothetical protein
MHQRFYFSQASQQLLDLNTTIWPALPSLNAIRNRNNSLLAPNVDRVIQQMLVQTIQTASLDTDGTGPWRWRTGSN